MGEDGWERMWMGSMVDRGWDAMDGIQVIKCDMNRKGIFNGNIWTEMGRKKLNKAYFVHNNPIAFYIFRTRTFLKEM